MYIANCHSSPPSKLCVCAREGHTRILAIFLFSYWVGTHCVVARTWNPVPVVFRLYFHTSSCWKFLFSCARARARQWTRQLQKCCHCELLAPDAHKMFVWVFALCACARASTTHQKNCDTHIAKLHLTQYTFDACICNAAYFLTSWYCWFLVVQKAGRGGIIFQLRNATNGFFFVFFSLFQLKNVSLE